MGKRELLLVAAFVIVGALVYQFTAPPPAPGERSFSLSKLIGNMRREVRGNRAQADTTTTTEHPVPDHVTEIRLTLGRMDVTITGEDRTSIEAELRVHSTGYDDPEALRLAKATMLKLEDAGVAILGRVEYPEDGRQTGSLTLRVPARLLVRLEPGSGHLQIAKLAGVELVNARGDTEITDIAGRVTANQTGGDLHVSGAGSLKVTTRGSDATLEHVRGESVLSFRSGEVKGSDLVGAVELETNSTDVTFDNLATARGTWRVNAVNGTLTLRGFGTDGRIDARNAEVAIEIARAAPLAVYADGGEDVRITAPPGGYQLDAVAERGRITISDGGIPVETSGEQQRAAGAVRGGGPTITIRSARGDIVVKPNET